MGFWRNIGKALLRGGITFLVAQFIEKQLNKLIKRQIINNLVKLILFLIAVFVSFLSLFGESASLFVSSIIILVLLLHSLVNLIPKLVAVIRFLVWFPIQIITQSRSPTEFVANFIFWIHPVAFKLKAKFDEKLNGCIPSADDLVDYVWGYIGKQVLIFGISFILFIISFNFIIKPRLQLASLGVSGIKIYLIPFSMAIDFICKTNTLQWVMN